VQSIVLSLPTINHDLKTDPTAEQPRISRQQNIEPDVLYTQAVLLQDRAKSNVRSSGRAKIYKKKGTLVVKYLKI